MSYLGLITAPWPFTVLAYIGTVIVVSLAAFVVWAIFGAGLPDKAFGWLRNPPRSSRVGQARTEAGHHRVQEVPDER